MEWIQMNRRMIKELHVWVLPSSDQAPGIGEHVNREEVWGERYSCLHVSRNRFDATSHLCSLRRQHGYDAVTASQPLLTHSHVVTQAHSHRYSYH